LPKLSKAVPSRRGIFLSLDARLSVTEIVVPNPVFVNLLHCCSDIDDIVHQAFIPLKPADTSSEKSFLWIAFAECLEFLHSKPAIWGKLDENRRQAGL
jgi:hypothetical protein